MAGEDVIVTIGVDASAANAALTSSSAKFSGWSKETTAALAKADKAVAKLEKSVAALDDPAAQAAASQAKLRAESEKLEKVASLLGPNMGGLVSQMSKLGKVAGSEVGGATLAIAGLAAGVGAALYALTQFGAGVLDTIESIDDLAASLDDVTRKRLAPQIASLRESKAALDDAAVSWAELKIVVADAVDGPLADAVTVASAVVEGWSLVGAAAKRAGIDIRSALGPLGASLIVMEAAAKYLTGYGNTADLGPGGGETLPADWNPLPMSVPGSTPAAALPPVRQTAPNRPRSAATQAAQDAIQSSMFLPGITVAKSQYDLKAAGLAALADLDQQYADQKAALDKQMADDAIAQIEREQAARKAATETAIAGASSVALALSSFAMQVADAQVASTKEGTEAHRQAMRDQVAMQEVAAAVNAAVGITQIWAQWAGQPVVAGALTVLEAAATGAAIAQLEAQKSKLHTGGLAPDEQYGIPAMITRHNERAAILTDEGRRHITADDIDRANSGAVGRADVLQVVVRDESGRGRRMSGRQFARPIPGVGQAARGGV